MTAGGHAAGARHRPGDSGSSRRYGNIFADLGFDPDEAERLLLDADSRIREQKALKIQVMESITAWMDKRNLTQAQAAEVLGTSRPRVSDVVNQKTEKFSIDTLIGFAQAAGKRVAIAIEDEPTAT